jgi:acetyltransferase-like isoleucine patch superfamily enzyme
MTPVTVQRGSKAVMLPRASSEKEALSTSAPASCEQTRRDKVKRVGLIGFGALGSQVLGLLCEVDRPDEVVFFDDLAHRDGRENSFPFNSFLDPRFADYDYYLGLGYRHLILKAKVLRQLRAAGRRTPPFVHPGCHVHPSCRIGDGCVLYPLCNLGQEVELEPAVLLANSVVVSHNSTLGTAVFCSPGVVLSGNVTVGEAAFLGTGTLVSNNRRIGARSRIGIGTVVCRDVPDDTSAIGNPMRLVGRPLELE